MTYIDEQKISEIRNSVNIVDIIKEYVPLTSKGKNFFGVCPFHQDHAPSMSVSSDKQIYRCFSCGAAGNVFTFVKDFENISFLEAVSLVAKKAGITFDYVKNDNHNEKYDYLYNILNDSLLFYQNNLYSQDGIEAINYLKSRCFTIEDIKEFGIGLALSGNGFTKFLKAKKYSFDDAVKTTLVSKEKYDHDVFVNRVMIPIHNLDGQVVGYTGRLYNSDDGPKYLNSKESEVFKKGNILFNYHRARNFIRSSHQIIIVEGNMDALKLYASGIKNVIALMGTALTSDQILAIKKLNADVVLMLDSDQAGMLATNNNGELLINNGLNVKCVILNGAKDPDEYINKFGLEKIKQVIDKSISFIEFKLEYYRLGLNLNDANDISKYIKLVLDDLKKCDDKILVDIILKKLSDEFKISYLTLSENLTSQNILKTSLPKTSNDDKAAFKVDVAVANLIIAMISNGKYIKLFVKQLGFLPEKWQRNIINEIRYYYDINKTINVADFISYLNDKTNIQDIVLDILAKYGDVEISDELFNEYIDAEKKIILNKEIKTIKEQIKRENDENIKTNLIKELTKLKKEVGINGSN